MRSRVNVRALLEEQGHSPTESHLLELLWQGQQNDEIAEVLRINLGTVKSKLFRTYKKLEVRTRSQAAIYVERLVTRARIEAVLATANGDASLLATAIREDLMHDQSDSEQ